ncbi:hypothetical protein Tco_1207222 [Tanacetum coccineum]
MAPKKSTRSTPATTTTTHSVTDAQLKALIDQGVAEALAAIMFPEEADKVERYVGGLPDMIHGSVMASRPKTKQDAIEFATELMDQKIRTFTECRAENKRKSDDTSRNNLPKRQNVAQAYTVGSGERKECRHLTRDCWSSTTTNNQRIVTYYECGIQGHYRSDCLRLKNQNNGNQAGGSEAYAKCVEEPVESWNGRQTVKAIAGYMVKDRLELGKGSWSAPRNVKI